MLRDSSVSDTSLEGRVEAWLRGATHLAMTLQEGHHYQWEASNNQFRIRKQQSQLSSLSWILMCSANCPGNPQQLEEGAVRRCSLSNATGEEGVNANGQLPKQGQHLQDMQPY